MPGTALLRPASLALLAGLLAAGEVAVTVDWGSPTGRSATPRHYGLNLYQGLDPAVAGEPGAAAYKAGLARMKPGLVRYHRAGPSGQMTDAAKHGSGWVLEPESAAYRWDRAKLRAVVGKATPWGPDAMMNIVNWPKHLDDGAKRLREDAYGAYADFCADLVRALNVELRLGIRYWEVTNERDMSYDDMGRIGTIVAQAAAAMKAVDPSIRVGGPAFARSFDPVKTRAFLATAGDAIDFLSYHTYSTNNAKASNAELWDKAAGLGGATEFMRARLAERPARPIELFHDEFNISWAPPDPKMNDIRGAIFDALALAALVEAGVSGACAWNEADGWYGKMTGASGGFAPRPGAEVYALYREHLVGEVVAATSAAPGEVAVFAVRDGERRALALVNRSGGERRVTVTAQGQPATLAWSRVAAAGVTAGSETAAALAAGIVLPADTVTVLHAGAAASMR